MINHLYDLIQLIDRYLKYLDGKIDFSKDGFPLFSRQMFLTDEPNLIVPYYNRHSKLVTSPQKTVLCFYSNDLFLYRRLVRVFDDIDEYKRYQAVIGMDITITDNMDSEWQDILMLINQLFLAILACNGVSIVMNARIGNLTSIKNMAYLPKNIMYATGFLGCDKLKSSADFSFISKILYLMPSKLLIYGKHDSIAEQQLNLMGIHHRVYPDFHRISKGVA